MPLILVDPIFMTFACLLRSNRWTNGWVSRDLNCHQICPLPFERVKWVSSPGSPLGKALALLPMQRPLPVEFSTSAPRGKEIIWACDARARADYINNVQELFSGIISFTLSPEGLWQWRSVPSSLCRLWCWLHSLEWRPSLRPLQVNKDPLNTMIGRIVFVINTVIQIFSFIYFTVFRL